MFGADRDIDGFVFAYEHALSTALHHSGPLDHNPVLGAVIMLLQAELGARLYSNTFDLEAGAGIDRAVAAPGPVARGVLVGFRPPFETGRVA